MHGRSSLIAWLRSSWWPGTGQIYLGEKRKGRVMAALYAAVVIPGWILILTVGWLPGVIAAALALPIAIWNQVDIRRTLGMGWRPLLPGLSHVLEVIRGRVVMDIDDPLSSDPERAR